LFFVAKHTIIGCEVKNLWWRRKMSVKLTPTLRINDVQEGASSAHAWWSDHLPAALRGGQVTEQPSPRPLSPVGVPEDGQAVVARKRVAKPAKRRGRGQMEIGDGASQAEEGSGRETGSSTTPRYTRRLSDKILIAFHHACDQADFEVAEQLLHILEMMLTRRPLTPDGTRRRNMESLVAAHERLWHLRHPQTGDAFV
jgi:hypothetical protein